MQAGKQAAVSQEVVKQFKKDLADRGYSARTAEVYATAVSSFLKAAPNPSAPTPEDADNYIRGILEGTTKGGASQSSVGIAASAIKLLFKHQYGKPLELSVELKRRARPTPSILSREEIQKIVTVTRNVSHRLIFQLMYSSGLKLDELLGLQVKDVDIPGKILTIRGNAKSGRKASCNSLRHSFAVHLLQKGTDIKHVRRLLGHARTETTSIYKRLITEDRVNIKSPLDL